MTKDGAAALVSRVLHHPEQTTGLEALSLMDALWGLVMLARDGEDIRPLLAKKL